MVSKHLKQNAGQRFERQYISPQNEENLKTQRKKPFSYTTVPTKQNKTIISRDYTVSHFKFTYDEQSDSQCSEVQK